MNCQLFNQRIDDYFDGELNGTEREAAASHLRSCAACRNRLEALRNMRAALRELPVPAPRAEFFEQALAQARPAPARWPWFAGAALAASLVLWVGFGFVPGILRAPAEVPGISIALQQPRTVQLAFNAENSLSQATVRIRLPEGVEIEGFPGQREIQWQTDLARGVNMLSLPLVATSSQGGMLIARLEHSGRSTEYTVQLQVNASPPTSMQPHQCGNIEPCRMGNREVTNASA